MAEDHAAEDLVATARVVRSYLASLLSPAEASRIDGLLASLIARAGEGANVDDEITVALSGDAGLRALATAILTDPDHRPPRVREVRLSGDGEVVDVDRFSCPEGDFVWYRLHVGESIPPCPTHGGVLARG
jgi:hypothetical protein